MGCGRHLPLMHPDRRKPCPRCQSRTRILHPTGVCFRCATGRCKTGDCASGIKRAGIAFREAMIARYAARAALGLPLFDAGASRDQIDRPEAS